MPGLRAGPRLREQGAARRLPAVRRGVRRLVFEEPAVDRIKRDEDEAPRASDVHVAVSLDFRSDLGLDRVESSVGAMETAIKSRYPEVKPLFVEAQSWRLLTRTKRVHSRPQIMEPHPPLETPRLILRQLAQDDAPEIVRLFRGDWGAVRHTGRMPWPVEEGAVRRWLGLHVGPHAYSFLVIRRGDRRVIGMAGFGGDGASAELGYAFGRRFWNQGYATDAVGALVGWASRTKLRTLEAYAFPENPASARVLEKAGFEHRGLVERIYTARGGRRRVHHYVMQFREEDEDGL